MTHGNTYTMAHPPQWDGSEDSRYHRNIMWIVDRVGERDRDRLCDWFRELGVVTGLSKHAVDWQRINVWWRAYDSGMRLIDGTGVPVPSIARDYGQEHVAHQLPFYAVRNSPPLLTGAVIVESRGSEESPPPFTVSPDSAAVAVTAAMTADEPGDGSDMPAEESSAMEEEPEGDDRIDLDELGRRIAGALARLSRTGARPAAANELRAKLVEIDALVRAKRNTVEQIEAEIALLEERTAKMQETVAQYRGQVVANLAEFDRLRRLWTERTGEEWEPA